MDRIKERMMKAIDSFTEDIADIASEHNMSFWKLMEKTLSFMTEGLNTCTELHKEDKMKKSVVEKLDSQLNEKVVPYCKDNEIPMIAVTQGTAFIMGKQEEIASLLGHLFEGLLDKEVFTTEQLLGILAVAKTHIEKGED